MSRSKMGKLNELRSNRMELVEHGEKREKLPVDRKCTVDDWRLFGRGVCFVSEQVTRK